MKQLSIYLLFILSFQPYTTAIGQQPEPSTGEIFGTVFQEGLKQPVASAIIRIVETGARITTDSAGEFRFRNLPPGEYTLAATASGYLSANRVAVTVNPGDTAQVEIYLEADTVLLDEVEVTTDRPASTVGRESLGGFPRFSVFPVRLAIPCVRCKPCRVSVSQTTSAARSTFAAAPTRITSTTLTACQSVIPIISAGLSPLSVPKL